MRTKIELLMLLFLAGSWIAYGQQGQQWEITDASKPNSLHLSLYAEAGMGTSFYRSTDKSFALDFSPAIGVVIGAGANLCFVEGLVGSNDRLSGQIGLSFARMGFSLEGEKIRGNYLCFPLSVQYYPIKAFYLELAMQPCVNMGLSPSVAYIDDMFFELEGHRANDFKIGLGAGYLLELFPIGVSARFLMGTSDFAKNLPWRGNQFSLCLFYRFAL